MTDHIPGDDDTRTITDSYTGETRQLTAEDLDVLRARTVGNITLDLTGVQVIDDLLHAVMWASKSFHNTSEWGTGLPGGYGPLREGEAWVDLLDSLARQGADEIRKAILR